METITNAAPAYTPPASSIVHQTTACFHRRPLPVPVHFTQYDKTLPILAVALRTGENGELAYTVPAGAAVNLRMEKADGHIIYNPALGLDTARTTAYIGITAQMTTCAGPAAAIVEIVLGGGIAGTAPLALEITRNPVSEDAIESTDEALSIHDLVKKAQESAAAAKASETAAAASASDAKKSETNAKASESAAENSKKEAAASASGAAAAKKSIEDMTVSAESLPAGSEASVKKTAAANSFQLHFSIPRGETGPQGPIGPRGPEGPQGISGTAVSAEGIYAFNVDENGHLILSYTGDAAPDFAINENGHLILTA